jgi:hypothetical protein
MVFAAVSALDRTKLLQADDLPPAADGASNAANPKASKPPSSLPLANQDKAAPEAKPSVDAAAQKSPAKS